MRTALAIVGLLLATLVFFACDEGTPLNVGAYEPIHVRGAQFMTGALPGAPPVDASAEAGPVPAGTLAVTDVKAVNAVATPGQAGKKFTGRTTDNAVAVGIRIADVGSGYWVMPVAEADPQFPGELTWEASIDFNLTLAAGNHDLLVVALDASGAASTEVAFQLCIASRIPDNLNACLSTLAPPEAVISLQWSSDVDLDLQVTTPDGTVVEPKSPTTVLVDAGRPGPDVGVIDRDSLYACVPDGLRQEDLVFQHRPTGTFTVAANMFDACKKSGTTFVVVVYEADGAPPNRHLVETYRQNGHLTSLDANGGAAPGLWVFDYPFGN
jgi:hypothetical protein